MRQQHRKFMDPPGRKSPAAVVEPTVQKLCRKPGVLVVDDEHMVRIMVQMGLEQNGFDVWLAAHGREAIQHYRSHMEDIDVVLISEQILENDACQTLDALRELNPKVQACLMTCQTGAETEESRRHSAAHVIAKPFLIDDLANFLRSLVPGMSAIRLPSGGVCREQSRDECAP